MALKLDMTKAYDRVSWRFLEVVMENMRFHVRWIELVMRYVTIVTYSILINGKQYGSFSLECGLRQRDLLSSYLFLLYTKGLSSILQKKKIMEGRLHRKRVTN